MRLFVTFLLFVYGNCRFVDRSWSTSVADMANLLTTEKLLINLLTDYAGELYEKFQLMNSTLMRLSAESAAAGAEEFHLHPLNTFTLIRRLRTDAKTFLDQMSEPLGKVQREVLSILDFPSSRDFEETVEGILRLQSNYNISSTDMAAGLLNGIQYNIKLGSFDSFSIGSEMARQQYYSYASHWLYQAAMSYEESSMNSVLNFSKPQLLEQYVETFLAQGYLEEAAAVVDEALFYNPTSYLFQQKKLYIKNILNNETDFTAQTDRPLEADEGCRGEFVNRNSKGYCLYNTTTNKFLILAPLKMEIISIDPYIALYHDVIYDSEIADMKSEAKKYLKRATIYGEDSNYEISSYRTTKGYFLNGNHETENIARSHQRIEDMTGLIVDEGEDVQVINYGLGGHYNSHFDSSKEFTGNDRIATLIYYLNDVEQGGFTVFPTIKISIAPRKGTALLFYNLKNNGEHDDRMLHAACPVLVGSKWIATKWIPERPQMLRKPC